MVRNRWSGMPPAFWWRGLSVAACLAVVACEKSSTLSDKASPPPANRLSPGNPDKREKGKTLADRLSGLRAQSFKPDPANQTLAAARAAAILADLFEKGDRDGLAAFAELFNQGQITRYDQMGEDLASRVPPGQWPAFLDFIGAMGSRPSCELAVSFLAKGILAHPQEGADAYIGKLEALQDLSNRTQGGDFYAGVWVHVGEGLYGIESKEQFLSVFNASSRTHVVTSPGFPPEMISDTPILVDGLNRAIAKGIDSGDYGAVKTALAFLPEGQKRRALNTIASGLRKVTEENYPTFSILMNEMLSRTDLRAYSFEQIGGKFDDDLFEKKMLSDPAMATSDAMKSILSGWAAKHPKDAVELVVSKTGNPDLAGVAFNSYVQQDSMEASKWLQTQSTGPVKDACMEQLCDYLLEKGSNGEAKAYLETLPADARERLAAKYPSP